MNFLIIAIGILSSISLVMSGLSTQRKRMLIFAVITSVLVAVQYLLTGSTLALIICSIGFLRNLTAIAALKKPIFSSWIFLAIFLLAHTVAFLSTANWSTLTYVEVLPLLGAYIGTTALFFKKMTITKSMLIACGAVWLVYEFHAGIYGQMVGEVFNLIANTFALVTLTAAARKGVAEEDVENVDTHIIDVITTSIPVIHEKVMTSSIPVVSTITKSLPIVHSKDA